MRVGSLDRQVHILRNLGTARNEFNETAAAWTPLTIVWASKRTSGGQEFLAGAQVTAEERAVFVIRYRTDLKPTDRLECEGHVYNIAAMREIGRRQYLEVHGTALDSGP